MTTVTTAATAISAGAVAPPATGGATITRSPAHRVEGRAKVTGAARYAAEYPAEDLVHAWPVVATIAAGRVTDVDTAAVEQLPGVLRVWWHGNAPVLTDVGMPMLAVLRWSRWWRPAPRRSPGRRPVGCR